MIQKINASTENQQTKHMIQSIIHFPRVLAKSQFTHNIANSKMIKNIRHNFALQTNQIMVYR